MKKAIRVALQVIVIFMGIAMIDTTFPNVYLDLAFNGVGALFIGVVPAMLRTS